MKEAEGLRSDIDDQRERSDRAEQRAQSCLAQSHINDFTSFDPVNTSTACE